MKNYIRRFHWTDIAHAFFVLITFTVLILEFGETVYHNTTNKVGEEEFHENNINDVEAKAAKFECLHVITDGWTRVQLENTVQDSFTSIFRNILGIYDWSVNPEWHNVENQNKGCGQQREHCQLLQVVQDRFENIGQQRNVCKVIKNVYAEPFYSIEISQDWGQYKQG